MTRGRAGTVGEEDALVAFDAVGARGVDVAEGDGREGDARVVGEVGGVASVVGSPEEEAVARVAELVGEALEAGGHAAGGVDVFGDDRNDGGEVGVEEGGEGAAEAGGAAGAAAVGEGGGGGAEGFLQEGEELGVHEGVFRDAEVDVAGGVEFRVVGVGHDFEHEVFLLGAGGGGATGGEHGGSRGGALGV